MKKTIALTLSLIMLLSLSISAFAAQCDIPDESRGVLYDNTISQTNPHFMSPGFATVNGNGNSLRYWFKNNSNYYSCTVQLYKKTILGKAAVGSSFTVAAGDDDSRVLSNPGSKTYYLEVTSTGGIGSGIYGVLRANQLNL